MRANTKVLTNPRSFSDILVQIRTTDPFKANLALDNVIHSNS